MENSPEVTPELTALNEAIAAAEATLVEDAEKKAALEQAIADAKAVAADAEATAEAFTAAVEALNAAVEAATQVEESTELQVTNVVATTEVTTLSVNVSATVENVGELTEATVAIYEVTEEGQAETAAASEVVTITEGAIEATFENVEDATYAVVVTVGEASQQEEVTVTVEFAEAIQFVQDVLDQATAENTIKLNELLANAALIEGYDVENVENIAAALVAEGAVVETIADINAIIKGLSETAVEAAFKAELVEAAALNNVKFAEYLAAYENVEATDADVVAYREALVINGVAQAKNAEEVQAIIDGVNAAVVKAAAEAEAKTAVEVLTVEVEGEEATTTELVEGVDQAAIDAAAALVEALEGTTEDADAEDYSTVKADLLAAIEEVQALLDAQTAIAAATEAVEALTVEVEGEVEGETTTELAPGVGQAEITAAQELVTALADSEAKEALQVLVSNAQLIQDGINYEAAQAAVEALTEIKDDVAVLTEGVDQAAIDAATALVELVADEAEKTALLEAIAEVQGLLDAALYAAALEEATEAVEALTVEVEGEEATTALAEGVDQAAIDAAAALVDALAADSEEEGAETPKADLTEKIEAVQELLNVALINEAIANEDVAALQEIIVGLDSQEFANLTKAQRAELGGFVIKAAKDAEPVVVYASTDEFIEAIDNGFVASYLNSLEVFNAVTVVEEGATITKEQKDEVIAAVEAVFILEGFTAVNKLDLAEFILEAQPVSVKTIAEIEALVVAFTEAN